MKFDNNLNSALLLCVLALGFFMFAVEDTFAGSAEGVSATVTVRSIKVIVSAPNGGENWVGGSTRQIIWSYTGPTAKNVILEFSSNNGSSWSNIAAVLATSSPYNWTVPNTPTDQAKVRIRSSDYQGVADTSNAVFAIVSAGVTLTSPNGGEKWQAGKTKAVTWTSSNGGNTVKLEYSTNSGTNWTQITASATNNGSYNWQVPAATSSVCKVRVTSNDYTYATDESNAVFSIVNLAVTSPNGGETLIRGGNHSITWTPVNLSGTNADILYSTDGGSSWISIATDQTNSGSYNWTSIPNTITTQGRIRVHVSGDSTISDNSDNNFSISEPTLTITSPTGGEVLIGTAIVALNWSFAHVNFIKLEYSTNSGSTWVLIAQNVAASQASYNWTIPQGINSSQCKLKISSQSDPAIFAISEGFFSIKNYPAVIIPNNYTVSFPDPEKNSSFRMLGMPGQSSGMSINQLVSGNHKTEWNAYYDNGAAANYMVEYNGTSTFNFSPGKAFWVLSRNPIKLTNQITTIPLAGDGYYEIPLHSGWNIISNPFDTTVLWSAVIAANGLDNAARLHFWNSQWSYATELKPFEGYYYDNNNSSRTSLKIPYGKSGSSLSNLQKSASQPRKTDAVDISIILNGREMSAVKVKFDSLSSAGYDPADMFAPPGEFEDAGIRLVNEEFEGWKELFIESRSYNEEGQIFNLQLRNNSGKEVYLKSENISLPEENEVFIFDEKLAKIDNLKEIPLLTIAAHTKKAGYKLLIGKKSFIDNEASKIKPVEFTLGQNYPNPFNPATVIRYSIPLTAAAGLEKVQLKVYDILGKEIIKLVDDYQEAGYYEVVFDASKLPSGVYIYHLKAGERKAAGKMIYQK